MPYLGLGAVELRMRISPSIIPTDRLDRDMYLVLEDFSTGPAWRETDEDRTDYRTLISDLLTGQYDRPLRVVAFNPLGAEELRQILELELEAVQKRIAAANQAAMSLTVSEAARKHILEEGTDARYGARHLRRAVERRLVFPIANLMATGQVQDGDRIVVELDPELGKLVFLKEFEDNRPEIAISAKTAA